MQSNRSHGLLGDAEAGGPGRSTRSILEQHSHADVRNEKSQNDKDLQLVGNA